MKPCEPDFQKSIYNGEKKDLIGQNGEHNYRVRVIGLPIEIEYIISLMTQVVEWCNRMGHNNNTRWGHLQDIFIHGRKGYKAWVKIRDRDYPHHVARTNQALVNDMLPKMLDEILQQSDNAEQIYKYIQNLKFNLEVWEAVSWADRRTELYSVADAMTCSQGLRHTQLNRIKFYIDSVGDDIMDEVRSRPKFSDPLDDANQNQNPKSAEEIASQIAIIQRKQNKDKNLVLNEEQDRFVKKNNGGGGGSGSSGSRNRNNGGGNNRGNGGGNKRNWSSGNNNQDGKRQRTNDNQNNQRQHNFGDKKCELPNHGNHQWKDCRYNYRNKDYDHEGAVRMAARDGVPGWYKGQVQRSTARKSGDGSNGNQYSQQNQSHYQWQQPPSGPPPSFNYHYQQQKPPPQPYAYMQMPPPHPQQACRGPGRNGPPSGPSSGSSGGQWVFQPSGQR